MAPLKAVRILPKLLGCVSKAARVLGRRARRQKKHGFSSFLPKGGTHAPREGGNLKVSQLPAVSSAPLFFSALFFL
jgi:hypothetical protein